MTKLENEFQAKIAAATDLDSLKLILSEIFDHFDSQRSDPASSFDPRAEDYCDLSSLPTFGGEVPAGTSGIYSWDESRLMYIDGHDITICTREVDE